MTVPINNGRFISALKPLLAFAQPTVHHVLGGWCTRRGRGWLQAKTVAARPVPPNIAPTTPHKKQRHEKGNGTPSQRLVKEATLQVT